MDHSDSCVLQRHFHLELCVEEAGLVVFIGSKAIAKRVERVEAMLWDHFVELCIQGVAGIRIVDDEQLALSPPGDALVRGNRKDSLALAIESSLGIVLFGKDEGASALQVRTSERDDEA